MVEIGHAVGALREGGRVVTRVKPGGRGVTLAALFASLYAVGVIVFAPLSFHIWQVRLADALLPLSIIFGPSSAVGFGLGCLVANVYGGFGIVDIVGGAIANFVACFFAWKLSNNGGRKKRFIGTLIQTLAITLIVGGYLSVLFQVPPIVGLVGILVGSLISINLLGFIILEVIRGRT